MILNDYLRIFTLIVLGNCLHACSFYKNAEQTTASEREFEVEGKMVHSEKAAIKKRVQEIDYANGIDELEAKAVVEKYLLDLYPQWLGWQIKMQDSGNIWKSTCRFAGTSKVLNIDKKNGFVEDVSP